MRRPLLQRLGLLIRPARRRLKARWLRMRGRHEDAVVQLARSIPGWLREAEIRLLYRTVRALEGPGDIAEIGSWKGRSTVVMGRALRDARRPDCRIHAIDPHTGSTEHREVIAREGPTLDAFRRNVRTAGVAALVETTVLPAVEAAAQLQARGVCLALVFVDGAHDEASVRADLRAFAPLVRPGGLVALHDCEEDGPHPGVWRAWQAELAVRAEEVARAESLLVARLPGGGAAGDPLP